VGPPSFLPSHSCQVKTNLQELQSTLHEIRASSELYLLGNAILIVRDDGKGIAGEVLARFRAGLAGGIGLAGMGRSMYNPAKVDP
jgi:hypothetical protein